MMTQNIPPSYALPALDDLIAPWPAPSWFGPLFHRLAKHASPYQRYAAMGLVLKRFLPGEPKLITAFADNDGHLEISRRVQAWIDGQEPTEMKCVAHAAEDELIELTLEFGRISAAGWPIIDLVNLAVRREILEEVAAILRHRGYAVRLMTGLDTFDHAAREALPVDRLDRYIGNPLLTVVRETGNKDWWGNVVSPV